MTPRPSRDRVRAQRAGRWAELVVCWWLRLKGWRILAVNWRCPAGEVDILARRGRILAAIEVKRRAPAAGEVKRRAAGGGGADAAALHAISARQQARIARAAEVFRARRPDCASLDLRLDAVTFLPGRLLPRLRHYPAAWHAESR